MLDRREFLRLMAAPLVAGASVAVYAAIIEPLLRLRVTHYRLTPPGWPSAMRLRLAVIADLHACRPWMSASHVARIVEFSNRLAPDCALLLGDYIGTHPFRFEEPMGLWAGALAKLEAPLGVHAVMGNHDWWSDWAAMKRGHGLPDAGKAMQDAGLAVYQNESVRLAKDGQPFWLAGLGDQIAFLPLPRAPRLGIHDLAGTLKQVEDDAPVILLAHEPDIFPLVPPRVSLKICGHTHGGQVNLFGWRPYVPSRYGDRYAYGHIVEEGRSLIVSGGLGCSGAPIRIGSPPEVVIIDLAA